MASTSRSPVRIAKVANRYILFDIDDVMYLRRNHNIGSVFIGIVPQNPSQNNFSGLPVELMPEEAQVLVNKNLGYVVEDAAVHIARFTASDDSSRKAYRQALSIEGKRAQMAAMEFQAAKKPMKYKNKKNKSQENLSTESPPEKSVPFSEASDVSYVASTSSDVPATEDVGEMSLFDTAPTRVKKPRSQEPSKGWPLTLTTSGVLLNPVTGESVHSVPIAKTPRYPFFAHLQDKGYFMMPGIRFGCHYNVYPGDPLRFHSHFQGTSYSWDEQVNLLDIVACGRLGTNVKKSYLIGGEVPKSDEEESGSKDGASSAVPPVRCFSIEWAAM